MSYSFSFRATDKVAAVATLASKFDEVVASQPVHEKDRGAALAAAEAIIGLCADPAEGQEVAVNVAGWVQWTLPVAQGEVPAELSGASVTASAIVVQAAK